MNFGGRSIVAKAITLRFVVVLGRLGLESSCFFLLTRYVHEVSVFDYYNDDDLLQWITKRSLIYLQSVFDRREP